MQAWIMGVISLKCYFFNPCFMQEVSIIFIWWLCSFLFVDIDSPRNRTRLCRRNRQFLSNVRLRYDTLVFFFVALRIWICIYTFCPLSLWFILKWFRYMFLLLFTYFMGSSIMLSWIHIVLLLDEASNFLSIRLIRWFKGKNKVRVLYVFFLLQ